MKTRQLKKSMATAIFVLSIITISFVEAAPPPPQWETGWGDDLDVYASIFVDAW